MARSKPSSPRTRPARILAFIRPNVRPSIPPPANAFELPIRLDTDHDSPLDQHGRTLQGEHGRNSVNDQSTGSQPTSVSTTEPSSSSARLDGQRRLSRILTPTSSEGLSSERGAVTSRATSNLVGTQHRVNRRRYSRTIDHLTASIDETLLGQGRWVTPHEPVQDVEFVPGRLSPEPPLPQSCSPRPSHSPPQSHSPWSGYPRTDDNEGGSASPKERRGGRKGGFEKEKAVKVGEMRQTKACLRCLFYRIECDDGDPCAQCRRKMRTWKLPCTRQRLPERLRLLFPDILIKHLEFDKVYAFMGTNAEKYLPGQEPFHLPLTQFLGEGEHRYLWLQVREVEPLGQKLLRRPGFSVVNTQDGPMVQTVEQQSPPLIPYINADQRKVEEQVSRTLELWLRRFLDEDGSNWQWYVFPKAEEQAWERSVLGQICRLLDPENEAHAKLEVAMELTFFNRLLTHSFAVPDEHIEWLYTKKLQHPQFRNRVPVNVDVEVCPRAVNTFLAMIVLHKVEIQAEATLEHINQLFASRDDSVLTGTLAFCESLLFMMVLAQLQRSVLERAKLDSSVYETTITIKEAKRLIKVMEDELATPIIELCVFKLRKVLKKRKSAISMAVTEGLEDATDQAALQFFNNLRKITELCGKSLCW